LSVEAIQNIVPELDKNLQLYPFNKSEYLIQHTVLNYQINVNEQTYLLVNLVNGSRTIKEIAAIYKKENDLDISSGVIHNLLYKKLAKFGIIRQNEFIVEKRKRASYLKLSFVFLKERYVGYFTKHLIFLFSKTLFYPLLFSMSLFIGYVIIDNYQLILKNATNVFSSNIILYLIAFQLGTLFHELGHAAACIRFGAKHGGIGFGFYLLTPVFFADVSDAWKLKPSERIVVNLGGIYLEMILASILLVIYFFNNQIAFLIIPCLLIISTLYNLNPLLKFDGYWVLVDATNTPNLQTKAFDILKVKTTEIVQMKFSFDTNKEVFLFVYAIFSASFIFFFIGSILIYDPNSVIKFPLDLYRHISNWKNLDLDKLKEFIVPFLFWYLVIRVVWSKIKKSRENEK